MYRALINVLVAIQETRVLAVDSFHNLKRKPSYRFTLSLAVLYRVSQKRGINVLQAIEGSKSGIDSNVRLVF